MKFFILTNKINFKSICRLLMLYLEMVSISRIPFINHISHRVYVELFKIEF
ncbi:unnamed protein product [Meloidogyne enterolobii]|uniref:Uncharacterized protein n=1 Tax=Meloidogyne enterolobii TaxID=390850 RepID=A0ACB0ZRN9_MELEN